MSRLATNLLLFSKGESAMKTILTDKLLRGIVSKGAAHAPITDTALPGFGVRFSKAGDPSFYVLGRQRGVAGPPLRLHVGGYPALSLAAARDKARPWIADLQNGLDPRQRLSVVKQEAAIRAAATFGALAEDFIRRHVSRARTAYAIELRIRRELIARWGDRPVADVTPDDWIALIDEILDRGHREAARKTFAYGRRLYNWAINRGSYGLTASPLDRLSVKDLVGSPRVRQRVLTAGELTLIWNATADWHLYGPFVRLLLLLGVRRSELALMARDELDLPKALWTIPASRTKTAEARTVPLPKIAVSLLTALPRHVGSSYVFTTRGDRPLANFADVKQRLDRRIAALNHGKPMAPWTFHDCRRTFRTALSSLGVPTDIAELCIGHRQSAIQRIYDLYRFDAEKRRALDAHAAHLLAIVRPDDGKKVARLAS
jgi:integrase